MAGLIIEINERNRSETRIYRSDTFPVRVGRGYQNDLIVLDPFMSPEHLTITEDEAGFVVEDLESTNGISVHGRRVTDKGGHIVSGDTITVGGTSLRLLSPSHPVPKALRFGYWSKLERRLLFCVLVWVSLLPTLGASLLDEYLSTFTKVRLLELTGEAIPVIIFSFGWAALWSLIGYSARRRTRFHVQLLISNAFIIAITFYNVVPGYIAFAVNCTLVETIAGFLGTGMLLALLLFCNLGCATAMRRRQRITVSLFTSVVVILVAVIVHFAEKPEFKETPVFSALLKPPYAKLAASRSIDEFLENSEEVFLRSREKNDQ
ncbi:MAG: FHA domain-containing protein [Lentisphaerae bacterium]|nr:FHA domain-containing protein [Lentisphaerota bacterium]